MTKPAAGARIGSPSRPPSTPVCGSLRFDPSTSFQLENKDVNGEQSRWEGYFGISSMAGLFDWAAVSLPGSTSRATAAAASSVFINIVYPGCTLRSALPLKVTGLSLASADP
jgi:hypothetical protein